MSVDWLAAYAMASAQAYAYARDNMPEYLPIPYTEKDEKTYVTLSSQSELSYFSFAADGTRVWKPDDYCFRLVGQPHGLHIPVATARYMAYRPPEHPNDNEVKTFAPGLTPNLDNIYLTLHSPGDSLSVVVAKLMRDAAHYRGDKSENVVVRNRKVLRKMIDKYTKPQDDCHTRAWRERMVQATDFVEDRLYKDAKTDEEYMDSTTLHARVEAVLQKNPELRPRTAKSGATKRRKV